MKHVDSYSDGMCGWVLMESGGRQVKVHWSVRGNVSGQGQAMDVGRSVLRGETVAKDQMRFVTIL